MSAVTSLGLFAACSSSSDDSSAAANPISMGDYVATAPGLLREISFLDATHYSFVRFTCPGFETGCTETGTYVRDTAAGTITFNDDDGFFSFSLPFNGAPSTSDTSEVTPQDLTGDGGTLTNGQGALLNSFQIGTQGFSPTTLVASDGGTALVMSAMTNWLPTVVNQQHKLVGAGPIITPTIVTVAWSSDANASAYEKFIEALPGSDYWKATTSEYGIGDPTIGAHVRLKTTPPTTLTTENLPAWISSQISAKGSTWPAPKSDGSTFYALFVPPTTSAHWKEQNQLGCQLFSGEHAGDSYKGTRYAYAINLECSGAKAADVEATASHELVEGSADPYDDKPGYLGFDANHLAWDLLQNFQDEIGDACEDFDNINTTVASSYTAQRTWSNAAAQAGHDPCVPAPAGPYFNISPVGMTTISIKTPKGYYAPDNSKPPTTLKGLGYAIKTGSSMKIPITLVSDTPGTKWTVKASEGAPEQFGGPTSKNLTLTLDKSSGTAGDTVNLTVKVNKASTAGEVITITSTLNGLAHFAPILISGN